jgi:hypothetical protein
MQGQHQRGWGRLAQSETSGFRKRLPSPGPPWGHRRPLRWELPLSKHFCFAKAIALPRPLLCQRHCCALVGGYAEGFWRPLCSGTPHRRCARLRAGSSGNWNSRPPGSTGGASDPRQLLLDGQTRAGSPRHGVRVAAGSAAPVVSIEWQLANFPDAGLEQSQGYRSLLGSLWPFAAIPMAQLSSERCLVLQAPGGAFRPSRCPPRRQTRPA